MLYSYNTYVECGDCDSDHCLTDMITSSEAALAPIIFYNS